MAADQDRAERIKKLKRARPDLKWRVIADRVGVTERAAASWAQTGGIAYDNAKRLAEIFEVDVDYIMRGNPTAPDLFGRVEEDTAEQLDRIEAMLAELLVHFGLRQPDEVDGHTRAAFAALAEQARSDLPSADPPVPIARTKRSQRRAER